MKISVSEAGILFRLCSHCPLCGSVLTVSLDMPELKECPLGHGCLFVHTECCEEHNHVIFEPVIQLPEKFYDQKQEDDEDCE